MNDGSFLDASSATEPVGQSIPDIGKAFEMRFMREHREESSHRYMSKRYLKCVRSLL